MQRKSKKVIVTLLLWDTILLYDFNIYCYNGVFVGDLERESESERASERERVRERESE